MVCLLDGSYAGRLSELISARVTCARAHLRYHEITSLAPDAYHVPQAFNKQKLALFIICSPPFSGFLQFLTHSRYERGCFGFKLLDTWDSQTVKREFVNKN